MSMEQRALYECPVLFDEAAHHYTLHGHRLSGVTRIVAWVYPTTYEGIPEAVLRRAADYGSMIHAKCELADSLGIVDHDSIRDYVRLKEEAGLVTLCNEHLVSDEHLIASSIDVLCRDYSIIDIKATSTVHRPLVTLQTSIYAWLLERQNRHMGLTVPRCFCLWLPKPQYGRSALIPLERIPSDVCEAVVRLWADGGDAAEARELIENINEKMRKENGKSDYR